MQGNKRLPDPLVPVYVKILRLEELSHIVISLRIDQYRSDHSLFCFPAMRDYLRTGGFGRGFVIKSFCHDGSALLLFGGYEF
jgi:hypothetical protein